MKIDTGPLPLRMHSGSVTVTAKPFGKIDKTFCTSCRQMIILFSWEIRMTDNKLIVRFWHIDFLMARIRYDFNKFLRILTQASWFFYATHNDRQSIGFCQKLQSLFTIQLYVLHQPISKCQRD